MRRMQRRALWAGLLLALLVAIVAVASLPSADEPTKSVPDLIETPQRVALLKSEPDPVLATGIAADPSVPKPRYSPCSAAWPPDQMPPGITQALIDAARAYFDTDTDLWLGHKQLRDVLQRTLHESDETPGTDVLAAPPTLTWLVSRSRSFAPRFEDPRWTGGRDAGRVIEYGAAGIEVHSADRTPLHLSLPTGYPDRNDALTEGRGMAPWPTLLLLHEPDEMGRFAEPEGKHRGVGAQHIHQRYAPPELRALVRTWIALAPLPERAQFLADDGTPSRAAVIDPLRQAWTRYHVDFHRVVLDGSDAALRMLESSPSFFAGAVLRGGTIETPEQVASVLNYAPLPVYVVDQPALAKALREAGHPQVTEGAADRALATWMQARCARWPRSFRWRAMHPAQGLAWWVNIDRADGDPGTPREMTVACLDTEEHPNTVKIDTTGIRQLSLFLSDELVDLGRKVRVVINDQVVFDAAADVPEHLAPLTRDMQTLFLHSTLDVRGSRFYRWLMGMVIPRLDVPPKREATPAEPREPEVVATARQEAQAGELLVSAKARFRAGDHDQARRFLDRALTLPANRFTEEIRAMLERLGDR